MQLVFDRGTVLLHDPPPEIDPGQIPALRWDPRVNAFRAPARLAYPIRRVLRQKGVAFDDTLRPLFAQPSGFAPLPLRDYQRAALEAWRKNGRRGVVSLPTGTGKTRLALAALACTATPALCLVPTRALLAQWVNTLANVYAGPIGCLGDGDRTLAPLTVATYASATQHMAKLGNAFGLLVIDEAHHFGNSRFDEALEMSIAPLRLGLTATPPPPGKAAMALARLIGPAVFTLDVADLSENLAPLSRVQIPLSLDDDERATYDALVSVYREALGLFRLKHPRGQWEDFVRLAAGTNEGRRGLAAWRRARHLLAFPRCKRRALAELLRDHQHRRTLVFVADNETAYAVAREHLIMPLTCDITRKERQAMLARFGRGELAALVSAQVLNEGLDVPEADVGIVVAGRLGEREHTQRVGRLLRPAPGKQAIVYELVVQGTSEVWQSERRWCRLAPRRRPSP